MIRKDTNAQGNIRFRGKVADLKAVSTWVQCLMHLTYGEEEGEKRYRDTRLIDALDLWSHVRVDE
tara:strand:+ start:563 stop:757 length:195 start_codon:yes stop_codon:yes gene_type:complete